MTPKLPYESPATPTVIGSAAAADNSADDFLPSIDGGGFPDMYGSQ